MVADNGQEQESVERTALRSPRPWCGSGIPQGNAPNKARSTVPRWTTPEPIAVTDHFPETFQDGKSLLKVVV